MVALQVTRTLTLTLTLGTKGRHSALEGVAEARSHLCHGGVDGRLGMRRIATQSGVLQHLLLAGARLQKGICGGAFQDALTERESERASEQTEACAAGVLGPSS